MTATAAASIFIPKGTILGYSFKSGNRPAVTGTVELIADAYIDNARREPDGSWAYGLAPGRTYFCAGGLAEVRASGAPGAA